MDYKTYFKEQIKKYPEYIDTVQMMQMCKIGKNTIYKWLYSEEINYERIFSIYRIERDSVLKYMYKIRNLQCEDKSYIKKLRGFYETEFSKVPDVLTNRDIARLTGYSKSTINDWIFYDKMKVLSPSKKNFVPKVYFIDFMVSKHAIKNPMKTDKHKQMLAKFESEVLK